MSSRALQAGWWAVLIGLMCAAALASAQPSVIPAPLNVSPASGSFTVTQRTLITAPRGEPDRIARYFIDLTSRTRGLRLNLRTTPDNAPPAAGAISFALDPQVEAAERYALDISPAGVRVRAREPRGLFYGAITLWALLTSDPTAKDSSSATLASTTITDAPRFTWRGYMLDSARHYQSVEFIKQMLDWMALHKLNTFHWHLTDDQGWRLQINKYPRLTEVGAWRVPAGAGPAADIDPKTRKPRLYGGFYTQDEVREIVRYAAERFITIVPEIEMPGHAQAPIAAYPALGTDSVAPPVSSDWGVHNYLYNVDDATFSFLEDVLTEVIALFPGQYVHIGGDEAVKDRWRSSPAVQQRMRELGIANETAMQGYFTKRMEQFLSSHGRKLIGWDEILEGGMPPAATVMSWRGTEGAIEGTKQGHDVVMSPAPTLYMDYLQSDLPDEPPGRPTYSTLKDVYSFKVLPDEVTGEAARHLIGAQINSWTEHMRTPERVEHAAFPRMAAFAENVWSTPPAGAAPLVSEPSSAASSAPAADRSALASPQNGSHGAAQPPPEADDLPHASTAPAHGGWQSFLARMPAQFARYQKLGIHYADSAFAVKFTGTNPIELSNQSGAGEIRYTLDGSEPTSLSKLYAAPFTHSPRVTVRAATFMNGYAMSASRKRVFDRTSALQTTDEELRSCSNKLVLRLEDDAPATGPRAVFKVDILDPCWIWEKVDLARVTGITATVGQIPFNFQVGDATQHIPLVAPESPAGELEVRKGSCEGERIAVLPLAQAVANHALIALPSVPVLRPAAGANAGATDLCLRFTRRGIDPIWTLKSVRLFE